MSKASKRQQELESSLAEAQRELTAARDQLTERTASIQELTATAEELTSRLKDLDEELERRPPTIDLADSDDPETALRFQLQSSMEREARLARRIAELEALRVMATVDEDAGLPLERARELDERIQALELQLEAARSREDALAARTVHANAVLADVGQRLAELGDQADRAERLDDDLARVTVEAAAAQAAAEDASDRLSSLEAEHLAALERADETELRASVAESRFAAVETELISATAVLRNLEEIYRVIRGRVEGDPPAEDNTLEGSFPLPTGPGPSFEVPISPAEIATPGFHYLTSADLVAAATREMGSVVPVDLIVLEDIAGLPSASTDDGPVYPGLHVKAAILLAELARRRPFDQGNERIALAATRNFFEINGYTVVGSDEELGELATQVSGDQLPLLGIAMALESATARTPAPGGASSPEGVKFAPWLPMTQE